MIKFLTEIPDYGSQLEDFVEGYYRMQIIKGLPTLTRFTRRFGSEPSRHLDVI